MKIEYIKGSLVDSPEKIIAHGCNAQGVMKSGVAKVIRDKYPTVYSDYRKRYEEQGNMLELAQTIVTHVPDRIILSIISQEFYGRDPYKRYVSYDAIDDAIRTLNYIGWDRIAFPKIGAGLGNGNWDTIASIIESSSKFTPVVYHID